MKVSIELPFFPGFYESTLYNSGCEYDEMQAELEYLQTDGGRPELTMDDLELDFEAYAKDVIDWWIDAWRGEAPKLVKNVEFEELDSPREYNFRTDRVFATVELSEDWKEQMQTFINDNYEWLKKKISKDWSSYDGFISFMDNRISDWPERLFEEMDERYIGTMIGYMMYREDDEIADKLALCALDNVYMSTYIYIINEKEENNENND